MKKVWQGTHARLCDESSLFGCVYVLVSKMDIRHPLKEFMNDVGLGKSNGNEGACLLPNRTS